MAARIRPRPRRDGQHRADIVVRHVLDHHEIVALTTCFLYGREVTSAGMVRRPDPTKTEIADEIHGALAMRGSDAIEYDPEQLSDDQWAEYEARAVAIVDRYWPALAGGA